MYSPEQTSEMLKIPPSTLRRYATQYHAHLSEHATKQHRRKYTEQDIAILARARELLSEGKSPEQVNNLLSVLNAEDKSPESTLALIPSISQALAEALDTARSLRVEVDAIHTTQAAHDERMSDAERKLSEMADKLAQLESDAQIPWYRKITRLIKREQTQ
jgi:DNA-binding transcriptional MerR regulator